MKMKIFKSKEFVFLALVVILLLEVGLTILTCIELGRHGMGYLSIISISFVSFVGIDKLFGLIAKPLIDSTKKEKEEAE